MIHKLQHLNNSGCVIDEQTFFSEEEMENYIDEHCLPLWESGDSIICDGILRECFNNYPL